MKVALGVIIGVIGVILLGAVSCVALVGGAVNSVDEEFQADPGAEEQDPSNPVMRESDGIFTYEITGASEQDSYTDDMDQTLYPDEHTFFVVDVTATNDSSAPADAPDPWAFGHVVGIDTQGQEHVVDDEPWTPDLTQVNPGASVSYSAVWDLPEGVTLENVEFAAMEAPEVALLRIP